MNLYIFSTVIKRGSFLRKKSLLQNKLNITKSSVSRINGHCRPLAKNYVLLDDNNDEYRGEKKLYISGVYS